MKSSTRQVDGVTIVDLSGRITLGEGSVVLRDTVRDLLSKGHKKILLNLGDVNYIDSSGIGELVSAFTTAKNQGGELKRSEEHTSELQSRQYLVCRLLLEKKNNGEPNQHTHSSVNGQTT